MKVSLEKAYDLLDWDFMSRVCMKLVILDSWLHLIMNCVTALLDMEWSRASASLFFFLYSIQSFWIGNLFFQVGVTRFFLIDFFADDFVIFAEANFEKEKVFWSVERLFQHGQANRERLWKRKKIDFSANVPKKRNYSNSNIRRSMSNIFSIHFLFKFWKTWESIWLVLHKRVKKET